MLFSRAASAAGNELDAALLDIHLQGDGKLATVLQFNLLAFERRTCQQQGFLCFREHRLADGVAHAHPVGGDIDQLMGLAVDTHERGLEFARFSVLKVYDTAEVARFFQVAFVFFGETVSLVFEVEVRSGLYQMRN